MSDFFDYQDEIHAFERDFPQRLARLEAGPFGYVLAGPGESAPHTLVFLNGGMNSREMWLRYVKDLSRDYQVLSFDYPEQYPTDQALLDGMHELFGRLSLPPVVLVGASMGGIVAQLYARKYPQDVEGLCLMSTAGLTSATMGRYGRLLRLLGVEMALMRVLPYSWFVRGEKRTCAKYVAEASNDARAYFVDMFNHIYESYTREKDLHVAGLMRDFARQQACERGDFEFLAGAVLLLLPEDDSAFPPQLQEELVAEMTDPVVVPHIRGGHLTTMIHYREYIAHIRRFLEERL